MSDAEPYRPPKRPWPAKFWNAFRAAWSAVRQESSFHVHAVFAVAVAAAAGVLRVDRIEWCILVLCITIVFSAELMNTALEHLAKAVDRSENPHIARALDLGSASVLAAALGAVAVGSLVFLRHLLPV